MVVFFLFYCLTNIGLIYDHRFVVVYQCCCCLLLLSVVYYYCLFTIVCFCLRRVLCYFCLLLLFTFTSVVVVVYYYCLLSPCSSLAPISEVTRLVLLLVVDQLFRPHLYSEGRPHPLHSIHVYTSLKFVLGEI